MVPRIACWQSLCLCFVLAVRMAGTSAFNVRQLLSDVQKRAATCVVGLCISQGIHPELASAGMLTFPLPAPLKNNYVLVRSGECFADARHETQTNPVKKLRQDNALTNEGREQMVNVAKKLTEMDYNPSFIWTSNTERSYEAAMIIARELQLGQNRIVPEYSFLDARSVGIFEGKNDADTWLEIHKGDSAEGTAYRPPPNNDGTPSESVRDVLVRGNQLVSTIESMHTGENVVIVSPDSDNLSILAAALSSEEPDDSLPLHAQLWFNNGDVRVLSPVVKPPQVLATGQTPEEARETARRMRALRMASGSASAERDSPKSWFDLWRLSMDVDTGSM